MLSRRQRGLKRLFDATIASATLVVVSPLIVATAILVKATSLGPAFYRHRRVGRNGVMFDVVKFRTMNVADSEAGWQITVGGDVRITRVGQFLRRTKIDEVPQLWNVLRGEMSLVGWRPHVAGYPDKLTGPDAVLIKERPGITGAATLYFRDEERLLSDQADPRRYYDEVIYPAKVRMDLAYFRQWSLLRDVYCLLVTSLPFTDRWVHMVPTERLPELADPAFTTDMTIGFDTPSVPADQGSYRPLVAVPVQPNGIRSAQDDGAHAGSNRNGHEDGHRPVVAVPVRSSGHDSAGDPMLRKPVVIRPQVTIHDADDRADAEDVASLASHDR